MIVGTVPVRTAAVVRAAALRVGVGREQLDRIPGIHPDNLGDELLRVPSESVWAMWELLDAAGGPGAGLAVTAAAARGSFTAWDYLFSSAPTLGESLCTAVELRSAVSNPVIGGAIVTDGGLLTVREAAPTAVAIAAIEEFSLSIMLRRAREATGVDLAPVRVALCTPAPRCHAHLVDEFGTARIDFGAERSEFTLIDAAALPTSGDPHAARMYRHYAELVLANAHIAPDWHGELRLAIRQSMNHGGAELDRVARRLRISARTLQRRLQEQGTTWREQVDAVRAEQAVALLRETDLTVGSIAARLGYGDSRAFRRAFTRWHGRPPAQLRRDAGDASAAS
ncbi:helix-turn-helix domain-containing protein [Nocardia sp. NBC_00511]|uniref:AraC family transcriptional regulator n=1 Tax=Nocardia sp. NBC_00511 TaxID=2903591 RepID=UPI0030E33E2C